MNRDAGRHATWLWVLVGFGPAAWFLDLTIGWALGPPAHESSRLGLIRGLHLAAVVMAAIGIGLAARELMQLPVHEPADALDLRRQRSRFLAIAAVVFGAVSLLLVTGNLFAALLLTGDEP